jgi:hypothetical protein
VKTRRHPGADIQAEIAEVHDRPGGDAAGRIVPMR